MPTFRAPGIPVRAPHAVREMKVPDTGLDMKILRRLAAGETRSAPIADALSKSRRMLQDYLTGLRARGLPVPLLLAGPGRLRATSSAWLRVGPTASGQVLTGSGHSS